MNKLKICVSFFVVICFISSVFAQDNILDPSKPGPKDQVITSSDGQSGEGLTLSYTEREYTQTDEYGELNYNRVLGSLGAAGNYCNVPFNSAFEQNFDGSVEGWVNVTAYNPVSSVIVSKGATSALAFMLGIGSSTNMLFFRIGSTVYNATSNVIPLNTWTHVAAVWSGGPSTFTVTFYVNGIASGTVGPTAATWNLASDAVRIGGSQAFTGSFLNGQIDEVRFWSDVRTLAEIRDNRFAGLGDGLNANSGSALTSSSHYSNCVSSWTFNNTGAAYDDIGLHDGAYTGAAASQLVTQGRPIPYNFVVVCPFGANDYVTVPDNAAFNASTGGTVEAWVYPTGQTTTHMLISRGTTGFNFFWGIRASIGNRQAVNIGAGPQLQNSNGIVIPINAWSHVAMTWVQSGGNYTCTFYVNGQVSGTPQTSATTWNSIAGTLRIGGWHGGTANNWNGRLDEVKFWNQPKTQDQIRRSMFCAPRGFSSDVTGRVGSWGFDGNLLNFSGTAGINGSFSTGGANNSRFSAFINETSTGAPGTTFISNISAVNRGIAPSPFPGGFALKAPFKPITDNTTTWDTIAISGAGTVTSVELFLSIRHTFCADLDITLRSPNGQTRDICSDNGSTGENVLTFFVDGQTLVSTATFLPPWSNLAGPEVAMGNMGSSATNGNWIISVADDLGGDVGTLQGWGIRLNGTLTAIEPVTSNIPNRFNLYQNYPNPFNPVTNIKFDIPKDVNAKLVIYDILGREVRTLVNEFTKAGQYEVQFDASNIASGTYFYRIEAGDYSDVKKFVVLK